MADNDTNLSLENAKWFARQLGSFSPKEQATLLGTRDFGEFEKIAGPAISGSLWRGRIDWQNQAAQGVRIPIATGKAQEANRPGKGVSPGGVVSAGAGLGLLFASRNAEYNNFKKSSKKYAGEKAAAWEKKPDPARAKTKEEAYELAYREAHDKFALNATKEAEGWAKKHKDQDLANALERKKILDEKLRKEWSSAYTPEEIQDPKIKSAIDTAIWQRRRPSTITSKGVTQQSTKTVLDNTMLDNNDPKQIDRVRKLLGKEALSQKDLDEVLMSHPQRIAEAEKLLGRRLGPQEKLAILKAHYVGYGARGKEGKLAGAYNYTQEHIAQKADILKNAGFDREQRRGIIEAGIAATSSPSNTRGSAPTAWTPIPANTLPGTLPPNTLRDQGAPNAPKDDQTPAANQNNQGFRNRLRSLGPRPIARRARGKFMGSRLGKRFAGSRLGRFAGKANRLGNLASKLKRKINKYLSPISYLQKLLLRSFVGSLISAASSILAAIAGVVTGAITFAIAALSSLLTTALGAVGISLGTILATISVVGIIIILLMVFMALLFPSPPGTEEPPPTSPYPGISLIQAGPFFVENVQNITYRITLVHDSQISTCLVDGITIADTIPIGTTLVEGSSFTTGNYDTTNPGSVRWKLSENTPVSNGAANAFSFQVTFLPEDEITVTNTISLEGCNP